MQKKSGKSKTKGQKSAKAQKVDKNEISYLTRHVDTSVAILESPEDGVVVEALMYLSMYADLQVNNLHYLYDRGLLQKLLNLFDRDVRVVRLVLRFLGVMLSVDEVMSELDREIYDDKILEICEMYVSHPDPYIKQFCVLVLSKLTESCRITCLIFKIQLFMPILDTVQQTTDMEFLEWTLELFLKLLNAPAAAEVLPEIYNFDISILLKHLENTEKNLVSLSFEVISKLTFYCIDVIQSMFRKAKLMENMFKIVTDSEKQEYHEVALNIISNSMKSEETSSSFIKSVEFLKFCQWAKSCDEAYHLPCILIFEQLTRNASKIQILFDLSVEDTVLSLLRSKDKQVLNKTCEAISNMMIHKYCCEHMLTSALLRELFHILVKKDEECTVNETVLKTILDFNVRNPRTLDIIHNIGGHKVLMGYFKKGAGFVSEESYLVILDIIYKMSVNPLYQQDIVSSSFFEKLLQLFESEPPNAAAFVCEIMTNFVNSPDFLRIFLSLNGPQTFVETLQNSKNIKLLKNVLLFILNSLVHENIVENFLQKNLVDALKTFPGNLKLKMPIVDKILRLIYDSHLPLKFFETNRLDISDKLNNKFYLINGQWKGSFPLYTELEESPVSATYVIYVIDYSSEVIKFGLENSIASESISPGRISSERTVSTLSRVSSSLSSCFRRGPFQVSFGKLFTDPFLPRYIYHVTKYLVQFDQMEDKVRILAEYIHAMLCEPLQGYTKLDKIHHFRLHIEILKYKLGSNMIPIGFLRLGSYCERALIFKAMADKCCIPATLVKGEGSLYWNEVAMLSENTIKLYVVNMMNKVGELMAVGSRVANQYCNLSS